MSENRDSFIKVILLVSTLIGAIVSIADFFANKLSQIWFAAIISILSLAWIYLLFENKIIKKDTPAVRNLIEKLSRASIFLIPVIIATVVILKYFASKEEGCAKEELAKVSIAIADFNPEGQETEPFSTQLIATLKSKARQDTSVRIKSIPQYFDIKNDDEQILALISTALEQNCVGKGIMTYGYWYEGQSLYNCYLFIKESEEDKLRSSNPAKMLDSLGYNIQLPDEVSFEIPAYVEELSGIILGIVDFYEGSLLDAKAKFQAQEIALYYGQEEDSWFQFAGYKKQDEASWDQTQFGSTVDFYLATIHLLLGDFPSAREYYAESYQADSASLSTEKSINQLAFNNYQEVEKIMEQKGLLGNEVGPDEPQTSEISIVTPLVRTTPPVTNILEISDPEEKDTPADNIADEEQREETEQPVEPEPEPEHFLYKKFDAYRVQIFRDEDWKFGLSDLEGNVLTDKLYDDIFDPKDRGYLRVRLNGKMNFINLQGKEIGSTWYEGAKDFSNNYAAFRSGKLWGFINSTGAVAISPQFDAIIQGFMRESAVVKIKKTAWRIDKRGNKVRKEKLR